MLDKKITFIGSGAMAEAMIGGLLRQNLAEAKNLLAADVREKRVQELHEKYGIQPFTENKLPASQADVVVLSVKPQQMNDVLAGLKGSIPNHALVLSIVAGAKIEKISKGLQHAAVVRSMPNTPAQISEGITVWMPSSEVNADQQKVAATILGAFGEEILVDNENYLDMATALSGTGPAYVYIFMEALIDAGVHMGFPRHISEKLVTQTISGSVNYYRHSERHPATLRNQVTSPGGTSAEALYFLENAGFRTAMSRAVWAAYQRSVELGNEKTIHIPGDKLGDTKPD
ncbi:MAG: pyrroline-5-carboxylate reductase [Anaerolineae bacterium]|nr:pyrroline-5-carboxylate reductase [Anaerolineae bacterium]